MGIMKKHILQSITSCAKQYKENLIGKNLLIISIDKKQLVSATELYFYKGNFLHLTGVVTVLSPDEFFDRSVENKLSEKDISLRSDGTTSQKLSVLPALLKKNLSANMIGDYLNTGINLYTEKMVGNVRGCLGFIKDSNNGKYVPNTVLEDDIRKRITNQRRIIAIYRKAQDRENYSEVVYIAKNTDLSAYTMPTPFEYLNQNGT